MYCILYVSLSCLLGGNCNTFINRRKARLKVYDARQYYHYNKMLLNITLSKTAIYESMAL